MQIRMANAAVQDVDENVLRAKVAPFEIKGCERGGSALRRITFNRNHDVAELREDAAAANSLNCTQFTCAKAPSSRVYSLKPQVICQRVDDTAFHLHVRDGSTSPKMMAMNRRRRRLKPRSLQNAHGTRDQQNDNTERKTNLNHRQNLCPACQEWRVGRTEYGTLRKGDE